MYWLDFIKLYWLYLLIGLVGLIVVYLIYRSLDDKTKTNLFNIFWAFKFPIFLLGLWVYLRYNWGFISDSWLADWRSATIFVIFLAIAWSQFNLFIARERYVSTHAVADNRSGSCSRYDFRKWQGEDYVILNLGSIDATAFPWYAGNETWVCPRRHFNKINKKRDSPSQIIIKTKLTKCDSIFELPTSVMEFIETEAGWKGKGYNKHNIYYGEFSQEELDEMMGQKIEDINQKQKLSLEEYELRLRDLNRLLNELRTMLKGKTSSIRDFVTDAGTIQRKARGEQLFGRMMTEKKEEGY